MVGSFFRCDLGDRLPEDNDRNGYDQGRGPGVMVFARDQNDRDGSQRGTGYVDQIVADQDGAQGIIKMLGNKQGQSGPPAAGLLFILQPHAVAGGIGHLRAGEKAGQDDAQDNAG